MQNEESALKMLEERVGSLGEANLMDTLTEYSKIKLEQ
jgi:hypothetical protein